MNPEIAGGPASKDSSTRPGVVLVAVLVVVVILALAGYQYTDLMMSEYRASDSAHRAMQAQKFADSGIYYAAAMLSSPENYTGQLSSNPWNNMEQFDQVAIQGDGLASGFFKIMAPADIDDPSTVSTYIPGVQDECAKINVNAWMVTDPTGQTLYNALMTFPNMTAEIANNIIAWMGGSYGIDNGGVGDDAYMGLQAPYHAKNGPIDSIDELLLVQGVTWDLLYGTDLNRNGTQEDGEIGPNGFTRGWSAFLTVHSREQNYDSTGNMYVYLNNPDLQQLYGFLQLAGIDDGLAKYIIMYRQYGGSAASNNTTPPPSDPNDYTLQYNKSGGTQIKSIYQLVNTQVSVSSTDPETMKKTTTVYASPLNDPSALSELLPPLLAVATLTQAPEIPARVNINTAPSAVLSALPGLAAADVQTILSVRPKLIQGDPISDIFLTPAWLLTEAQLSAQTLQQLDPYITTRSQVYRVQSLGYFAGKGPSIRVEAVIDTQLPLPLPPGSTTTTAGRPRILAWRNLSELGKGLAPTNP